MKRLMILAFVGVVVATSALASVAPGSPKRASGELQLNARIHPTWQFGNYCPLGTAEGVECVRFRGVADVAGLGRATVIYVKTLGDVPDCSVTQFRTAVITVAGKGQIDLSMPRIVCGQTAPAHTGPLEVIVTGGSGVYAGAYGTVQFESSVYAGNLGCGPCGGASDTWTGTLGVEGLDFDVTAPRLTGTVSKTVRAPKSAKRVRVRFAVAARDGIDGSVPVACTPRTGSLFKLGRTKVTCSATDTSGNTSRARFTVTVK